LYAARSGSVPSLSIVIPSHNRPDLLRACLRTVTQYAPCGTEILVVDDASEGHSVSTAAASFSGIRVLRLAEQRGFCVSVNAGINATQGTVVELLNDDTEVTSGWAERALAHFADSRVGAVAPLVLRRQGEGPPFSCPIVDSAGDSYYWGGIAGKRGHDQPLNPTLLTSRRVFGASASSGFFRRAALEHVGAMPESFGAYFEDVDLAFRLHWAGYETQFEPASRVYHHVSASYGPPARLLLEQQSRNEERVFWRNLPDASLMRALPVHLAVVAAKAWRRWRAGELIPFLRGRLQTLQEAPAILRHRQALRRLGQPYPGQWQLESWYGSYQRMV
jgi:GT2 family glycosyltransferase